MTHEILPISAIVCTRDRPLQLKRCLEMLQRIVPQSGEIIVVDNGSRNFVTPDIHYRVHTRFFSQPIRGLSNARNLAVEQARGEILAFTDDDAVPDQNWIAEAIPDFENSQVGCVTGKVLPLTSETEWETKAVTTGWYPDSDQRLMFDQQTFDPLRSFAGVGCNFFARRKICNRIRFATFLGAGTPSGGAEDHYFFYSMIRSGCMVIYEPKSVVFHEFVKDENSFQEQVARNERSRGAYLTRFLLCESGYKFRTLKHIFRSAFGGIKSPGVQRSGMTARGILMGPPSLLHSMYLAKRKTGQRVSKGGLIAEFLPESQDPATSR